MNGGKCLTQTQTLILSGVLAGEPMKTMATMERNTKMSEICTLSVTIDGSVYHYEAHTFHRCAEILAGTLRVLDTGETDEFGQTVYSKPIESFEVHYFQNVGEY